MMQKEAKKKRFIKIEDWSGDALFVVICRKSKIASIEHCIANAHAHLKGYEQELHKSMLVLWNWQIVISLCPQDQLAGNWLLVAAAGERTFFCWFRWHFYLVQIFCRSLQEFCLIRQIYWQYKSTKPKISSVRLIQLPSSSKKKRESGRMALPTQFQTPKLLRGHPPMLNSICVAEHIPEECGRKMMKLYNNIVKFDVYA